MTTDSSHTYPPSPTGDYDYVKEWDDGRLKKEIKHCSGVFAAMLEELLWRSAENRDTDIQQAPLVLEPSVHEEYTDVVRAIHDLDPSDDIQ